MTGSGDAAAPGEVPVASLQKATEHIAPGTQPLIDEEFLAARQRLLLERLEQVWQVRREEVEKADTKASFLLAPIGIVVGIVVNNVAHIDEQVRSRFYPGICGLVLSLLAILAAAVPRKWAMVGEPRRLLSDRYRSVAESTLYGTLAKTLELALVDNEGRLKWKHRCVYAAFVFLGFGVVALVIAYLMTTKP